MKKKLLILTLLGINLFTFIGCSNINNTSSKKINNQQIESNTQDNSKEKSEENSLTLEESNKKIRNEAVKGDFVKINSDEFINKAVYITGKVSNLDLDKPIPRFTLTTEENEGYGIYSVVLFDIDSKNKIKTGETLTIYGYVLPKNSSGLPEISANIIES